MCTFIYALNACYIIYITIYMKFWLGSSVFSSSIIVHFGDQHCFYSLKYKMLSDKDKAKCVSWFKET